MSVYQLKTQFQNKLRPISDRLVEMGMTANQVTVSAICLSAGTAYVIAAVASPDTSEQVIDHRSKGTMSAEPLQIKGRQVWWILPVSLFIRMALNAIDGMMAREHHQASSLGAVLNEAGDIISDGLLIGSLTPHLSLQNHQRHHLGIIIALSTLTELIAIGANIVTGHRANHGPLGKSDRALALGIVGALIGSGFTQRHMHSHGLHAIRPLLWFSEVLLLKTAINRLTFIGSHYFQKYHPVPTPKTRTVYRNFVYTPLTYKNNTQYALQPYCLQGYDHMQSSDISPIIAGQSCFNAYDGTAIYYRYWLTMPLADIAHRAEPHERRQVILLHRGHEHSGRLTELAERFVQAGYQVFAWDARGNGRSGGIKDHAESVTELERDLNDFVNLVITKTGITIEDTLIVASSIGAVLAAAWVHDYAPAIRGMILGTPALSIRLYIPLAIPALKVARKLGLMSRVSSYVKSQVLTHDKEAQAAYNADPLISGSISSDLLIDTHATGQRLLDDAGAITTPTFILCAGKDYVVDKQAERTFYERLSSPHKRWQLYPDSFHAIFHETNKADIFADCIDFAEHLFAKPTTKPDLTHAHLDSASKDKVDRLAIKPFNPSFALTRFAMQKFGHVSDAIATGLEHGFDSGSSLDKVYANTPQGKNTFGKAVDKFYLSNIGWQGIRIRRKHLLELASMAIDTQLTAAQPNQSSIRALDIASGNGYYVFDLLEKYEQLTAELRDYDTHNVQVIADKAHRFGFDERIVAVKRDAFDIHSYSDAKNSFDMAIASGVFELFSDNTLVSTALTGIFDSLAIGGYFIYTNQPWHPEQEFISKTLNNHRGSSWVMRCRSQAEMDQLVTQAGFKKLEMRIDRFGIFTVSLAIKPRE
ncbi:alpha/beta fold hydrolase [Psychrobacter sp. F1192]|uniref:Alpha/beta fold hydrolase n=1 Tax=Psychrobacter coccoides TaxID=2818440 RepID=A0ABS3NQ12_9GAMM|nr:alpha/beta fold hydrolase [Psychrobacter coccoides]MBO1531135.1 alpha/beta fold hydrolase [Psychrobacter coccoides]